MNRHTDNYNLGPSYIIALGDWSGPGGELWTHDLGAVDVRRRWQRFYGAVPHCTFPWDGGHRYTLVYYTNRHFANLSKDERKLMVEELGFLLPEAGYVRRGVAYAGIILEVFGKEAGWKIYATLLSFKFSVSDSCRNFNM